MKHWIDSIQAPDQEEGGTFSVTLASPGLAIGGPQYVREEIRHDLPLNLDGFRRAFEHLQKWSRWPVLERPDAEIVVDGDRAKLTTDGVDIQHYRLELSGGRFRETLFVPIAPPASSVEQDQ